jgi:hypothetical protein
VFTNYRIGLVGGYPKPHHEGRKAPDSDDLRRAHLCHSPVDDIAESFFIEGISSHHHGRLHPLPLRRMLTDQVSILPEMTVPSRFAPLSPPRLSA